MKVEILIDHFYLFTKDMLFVNIIGQSKILTFLATTYL